MRAWVAIVVCLLLAGCKRTGEARFTGDWKEEVRTSDTLVGSLASAIMPNMKISINSDHTFVLYLPALEIEATGNSTHVSTEDRVEGTWVMNGDQVSFTPSTSAGQPVADLRQKADKAIAEQKADKERKAALGYASDPPGSPFTSTSAPVLPETATVSEDGKRLTIHFENNAEQAADFVRG